MTSLKNTVINNPNSKQRVRKRIENEGCIYRHVDIRLYDRWRLIVRRCCDTKSKDYKNYGGRGIQMCKEWLSNFDNFYLWSIANGWESDSDLTIDRVNNDKDYEPSNCRWATDKVQRRNKRTNHNVEAFGEVKTLTDWVDDDRCVVSFTTLKARLVYGWDARNAITAPVQKLRRKGLCL